MQRRGPISESCLRYLLGVRLDSSRYCSYLTVADEPLASIRRGESEDDEGMPEVVE